MRTWDYLVQYESDFRIATEKGLLPSDSSTDGNAEPKITHESLSRFLHSFKDIPDSDGCPRYTYGEFRLTRLNFYSRIFLGKLTYHHIEAQWVTFLNSFLAPFVVVFGMIAIILSAMQVELRAIGSESVPAGWSTFTSFCKWFSIAILAFVAAVTLLMISIMVVMFVHDMCLPGGWSTGRRRMRTSRTCIQVLRTSDALNYNSICDGTADIRPQRLMLMLLSLTG